MTLEEFWQDGDKDYVEFECEKSLVAKLAHATLSWPMKKLHELYYLACVYELNFIETHIPREVFKSSDFDLHAKLYELHTIYHLRMLDVTMMIAAFKCFKYFLISSVLTIW
jgi:hypothetical protein